MQKGELKGGWEILILRKDIGSRRQKQSKGSMKKPGSMTIVLN